MTVMQMDNLLTQSLKDLLEDLCTPNLVRSIEAGESPSDLWTRLEKSGYANALVPESAGGAGLALRDVFSLFELCGNFAVPVPLSQTMLARSLLANAGLIPPEGAIAIASVVTQSDDGICCLHVPFGRIANWVIAQHEGEVILLPVNKAKTSQTIFELDASLEWSSAVVKNANQIVGVHDLEVMQACCTAAQISGALINVFTRTLEYANFRQQFGRPIGKFQVIQHQLSVLSEHTFAARLAAQIGCYSTSAAPDRMRVAVAKARTSEAAIDGATIAHSIHGAIGFTAEFNLQLYTRRLHVWRRTGGSESYWHSQLGEALVHNHSGLSLDFIRLTTDID